MVADGRLSAEEAEPILAALDAAAAAAVPPEGEAEPETGSGSPSEPSRVGRSIRLEVTDGGRVAVKLRLPASLGDLSLDAIPGLSGPSIDRIRAALTAGTRGPVFEAVDETGDGVRIVLE